VGEFADGLQGEKEGVVDALDTDAEGIARALTRIKARAGRA
jgi:hypothetical protein